MGASEKGSTNGLECAFFDREQNHRDRASERLRVAVG